MANLGDISKIKLPNGNIVSIKDKIARESLVPAVGSSDNSKVLTASYNNGEGSYSWQPASGGGTSDVIQGYYYNNKFYEDSSHTIEIQGEVDKLYADIGSATDGWDLYMWANKAGNNAFTSIYDRLYKEGIAYGTCDTSLSTAAKTVSITGFKLQAGSIITVKFTNALSLSSAKTLNVNSTGAKSITYNNSSTWSYQFAAGSTITFMYDGLNYAIVSASPGVQSASSGGTTITEVTTGDKYTWNNKQAALTTTQLNAVNSGINSTKVAQIETNKNNITMADSVALTYVSNSYVNNTAFARCSATRVSPHLIIFNVNLQSISEPSSQMLDFETIGTLPYTAKQIAFASQDKLTLYVTGNTIKIFVGAYGGTTKYNLRQSIPVVIN